MPIKIRSRPVYTLQNLCGKNLYRINSKPQMGIDQLKLGTSVTLRHKNEDRKIRCF